MGSFSSPANFGLIDQSKINLGVYNLELQVSSIQGCIQSTSSFIMAVVILHSSTPFTVSYLGHHG